MATTAFRHRRPRRGGVLLLVCILMVVLVGMVAFTVDMGRMFLVRAQLQTAVDAGALAANLKLKRDPNSLEDAKAAAENFVQLNRVGWFVTVPSDSITVEMGTWDPDARAFAVASEDINAVRVRATREDEPFFFGRIFGKTTFDVPRAAVASSGPNPLDIMLVLDLSGSMKDNGRIEALQNSAPKFVDMIEEIGGNDQIGIMGYGAQPEDYDPADYGHAGELYVSAPAELYPEGSTWVGVLESNLTDSFSSLKSGPLSSGELVAAKYGGWTPVGAAIRDASDYLAYSNYAREGTSKVIVLMTDGHANRPKGNGPGYAMEMAKHAAGLDVKIYTIALGNSADENLLESIAEATGAEFFDASGSGEAELTERLTDAFQRIAITVKRAQLVQ